MAKTIVDIEQSGPPTENTPGAVGQDYVDTETGLRWECVESSSEKFYKGNRTHYSWVLRGLDPDFVVYSLSSGGSGATSLPVKLNILETVCDQKIITGSSKKYEFPSKITLTDGDLYLLVYRYFYNGLLDLSNSITAVSQVINGEIYWGNDDINNRVMMVESGVYDHWLATDDDTTRSIIDVYKVQKVITDDAAYHAMHLEGYDCLASGLHAHAEGCTTLASGMYSHAEGTNTEARGEHSHAEGFNTKAAGAKQHVEGSYNVVDDSSYYAHILGNGISESNRSNAHTIDWDGNAWFAGEVKSRSLVINSSTLGSTKKFRIAVNDEGVLTAVEE